MTSRDDAERPTGSCQGNTLKGLQVFTCERFRVSVAQNFILTLSKQLSTELSIRVVHIDRATARSPLGLAQALLPYLLMWTYAVGIL